MSTLSHLLVPTDGSEGALKAAAFAGDLAWSLQARIQANFQQCAYWSSESIPEPYCKGRNIPF
jgi:hypothetical protein